MGLSLSTRKSIRGRTGTEFKRIIARSDGRVLWKASSPYYAIQNGKLVNAPNAYAWCGGYSESSGEISNGYGTFYGGCGHTDDYAGNWGGSTGNMDARGCKYVTVTTFTNNAGAVLSLYGNDALIRQEGVAVGTSTYTFDISAYSVVGVLIDCFGQYPDRNEWMNVGLVNVQFHD